MEPSSEDVVLTAVEHNGKAVIIRLPATTVTYDDFADLTSGFNCLIYNRSAEDVTFVGIGHPLGHTRLRNGGVAAVSALTDSGGPSVSWTGGPSL